MAPGAGSTDPREAQAELTEGEGKGGLQSFQEAGDKDGVGLGAQHLLSGVQTEGKAQARGGGS